MLLEEIKRTHGEVMRMQRMFDKGEYKTHMQAVILQNNRILLRNLRKKYFRLELVYDSTAIHDS
jgi:hypothetical protein